MDLRLTLLFALLPFLDGSHSSPFISANNVCLTPGCVQAASEIISNLNESVDPCDNFYSVRIFQSLKFNPLESTSNSLNPPRKLIAC